MAFTNEFLYRAHPAPNTPAAGNRVILAATQKHLASCSPQATRLTQQPERPFAAVQDDSPNSQEGLK
jgi:hypothetical protein